MLKRIRAGVILAAILVVTGVMPADANDVCDKSEQDRLTGEFRCVRYKYVPTVSSEAVVAANPGHTTTGIEPWTPPPGYLWFVWWEATVDTDGDDCKYVMGAWLLPPDGAEITRLSNATINSMEMARGAPIPLCDSLADIAGPPPVPSAEVLWDAISATLPRPDPLWLAPGEALTGLPAWLETNRALRHTVPPAGLATMPGGLVSVDATATFTIDWGDPFADPDRQVYEREGIAFDPDDPDHPDGIRHTYTTVPDSGAVTITVADDWTVTFEDRWGRSDTLTGTITTSTTVPVTERQAVIVG